VTEVLDQAWPFVTGALIGVSFAQWWRISRLARLGIRRELRAVAALGAANNLLADPTEERQAEHALAMVAMADELETQFSIGFFARIPEPSEDWPNGKLMPFVTDGHE